MYMKKQNIIGFLAVLSLGLLGLALFFAIQLGLYKKHLASAEKIVADLQLQRQVQTLEQQALMAYIKGQPDSLASYCHQIAVLQKSPTVFCDTLEQWVEQSGAADQNWAVERVQLQQEINQLQIAANAHHSKVLERDSMLLQVQAKLANLQDKNYHLNESMGELYANLQNQKADTLTFVVSTGNRIRYMGQIAKGRANGTGSGFWPTGGYYHGEWRDNQRHGRGLYLWKEGDKYSGQFKNDQRAGTGTYFWTNGERYEGQWKNNQRSGAGTLYAADGTVKFSGQWVDDKPQEP